MKIENRRYYSDAQLTRFAGAVQMLSYDHGDTYKDFEAEHHGSGVFVLFNDHLFFLCTKHSFHGGNVSGPMIEDYDSLCFLKEDLTLSKPKYTRITPSVINKDNAHMPEEDILIYLIDPTGYDDYDTRRAAAATISSKSALKALIRHNFYAFFYGFPNQYGGNVDYEEHKIHKELKGRYALVEKNRKEPNFISAIIDTGGFMENPTQKGEFCMNGMSGGGLFTCSDNDPSLLLGMCLSGTVKSKKAHFLSVCYIEYLLSECIKSESIVSSQTMSDM